MAAATSPPIAGFDTLHGMVYTTYVGVMDHGKTSPKEDSEMKATKTPVICEKCGAETHYPITVIEMVYAGEVITNTVCGKCETEMMDGPQDGDGYE